ncbi:S1 family peptidase [Corynebacterium afermentans]|nr:S1 family peptidase [Corynebacterium afermentans]
MSSQRTHRISRALLAAAVALGMQAAPAETQTRVEQGAPVLVDGTGTCTIGFNDPARHRSLVAAHCGAEGARVNAGGATGTLFRSKAYDGHLSNDWAAIQWDPGVHVGGNRLTGDAWVHPGDVRLGETVCYFSRTRGAQTCGRFSGSADGTFFAAAPLSHPGDSGGPMWVPGRGFIGVVSSMWTSNPLPFLRGGDYVIGIVPHDGPAVPEARLVGVWGQNALFTGLTGPVAEVLRKAVDGIFRALAGLGLGGTPALRYK